MKIASSEISSFFFPWLEQIFVINFFLYFFFSLFFSKFYNWAIVMPEAQAKLYFFLDINCIIISGASSLLGY